MGQPFKKKIEADEMLNKVITIQSLEKKLIILEELFKFYKQTNDSLKFTVLDILKTNARKYNDNNAWASYYYQRSSLEVSLGGNLFSQTIDSSYKKAKAAGNTKLMIKALSQNAEYLWRNKRLKEALDVSLEAVHLSEVNHFKQFLPYRYMTTSMIYRSLKDTVRQYNMALKACAAADSLNDLEAKANCNQVLADIMVEKKEYDKAIALLNLSIKWFTSLNLGANIATIQLNLADTYTEIQKFSTAKLYVKSALKYFSVIKNTGLMKDANATLAKIYEKQNMQDSAIYFYNTCIAIGIANNNPLGNAGYYKSLSDIYLLRKEYQKSAESLNFYTLAHDSILTAEKNKAIEELSVKYETEKKDNDIIVLNKDKDIKEQLFRQQKLVRNTLIGGIILLLLLGLLFFNRIQLRKKVDQQKTIAEERERIITDLHDDVGATLSSMHIYGDLAKNVWETQPQESKKMIDKISTTSKDLMNRMGDIIWSMKPADEEKYSFKVRLTNYCTELLSPKNILAAFDVDETLAANINSPEVRKNLLLIAKESINNIAKYSEASKVTIAFKKQQAAILLSISDNGKGFEVTAAQKGNGLQNIQQRCKHLNGLCSINTGTGQGTSINCSFPIAIISHS